jgi:hypothetical protein
VPLPHSRLKLRDVSRSLYAAMGMDAPAGLKDQARADPLNYDRPTWQQAKRLGEDPRDLKRIIQDAWAVSDNRASFESALHRHALHLARGDRRGFVVVHHSGEPMSLTRYGDLKKRDIEARIGKPEHLPTVDQVQSVLRATMTDAAEKRIFDLKDKHRRESRPLAERAARMRQAHRPSGTRCAPGRASARAARTSPATATNGQPGYTAVALHGPNIRTQVRQLASKYSKHRVIA